MSSWINYFYFSVFSAALLLSAMGLWFTAIIPGIDRWNKRFFLIYFFDFMLCCICGYIEMVIPYHSLSRMAAHLFFLLEDLFLALPIPMLTVYLLHCCGEDLRSSRMLRVVVGLCAVHLVVIVDILFIEGLYDNMSDGQYARGPLYQLMLASLIAILLLNFVGTLRRRARLSRKTFLSFLIAIFPVAVSLIVQMFVDVFPLIDISYVISALAMYSFALSDQIEQDRRYQREIAHQRASVMVLQMRPHFIYNTLISIYGLCNLDPKKARQVTMDFTDYLRKNFNAVASDSAIPFTAELEHTSAYVAVEKAQYEDMLLVDYDTPFIRFRLPPLTLQPIVENAVKHGMNPYAGPLRIAIRTRHTDSAIEIIVEDNGPGFDPSEKIKPQTTLANIRQRLEMMCGGSMTFSDRDGGGTIVKIKIPSRAAKMDYI